MTNFKISQTFAILIYPKRKKNAQKFHRKKVRVVSAYK